jgi:hypothetical protein
MRNVLKLVLMSAILPGVMYAQQTKKTTTHTKTTVHTAGATKAATPKAPPHYAPPAPPPGPPQPPKDLSQEYRKHGSPIPPLAIEKLDGQLVTNAQLQKGKSVWLMIFSPQCEHCEHMVDSIKGLGDKMSNVQLIMVAEPRNKEFLAGFIKKKGLADDPMFQQLGTDKGNLIYNIYNYQVLPQINIYDTKQHLETTAFGSFIMDTVKNYLPR